MNLTASQERWLCFWNEVVYRSLAPLYDALDVLTLGAWWRLVRRALEYVSASGRVLEIGFGPGKLQVELAERLELCFGLDLAWGMCRFTQRRLRRAGLVPRLVCGDARRLPFAPAAFDAAVSTFAISGIRNAQAAASEQARVIAPGGRVVLVDIGLPSDGNRLGRFLARLWERMGDFLYDQRSLMHAAGLEVVEFEEFGPGRHVRAVVGERRAASRPGEASGRSRGSGERALTGPDVAQSRQPGDLPTAPGRLDSWPGVQRERHPGAEGQRAAGGDRQTGGAERRAQPRQQHAGVEQPDRRPGQRQVAPPASEARQDPESDPQRQLGHPSQQQQLDVRREQRAQAGVQADSLIDQQQRPERESGRQVKQ